MKRLLFTLKSWALILSASFAAKFFSLFLEPTLEEQSTKPFIFAIATSVHHFALAIMWAQSYVGIHGYSFYILFSGTLFMVEFNGSCSEKSSIQLSPLGLSLGDSKFFSMYFFLLGNNQAPLRLVLCKVLHLFSQNVLVVPHVTPWIFPCFTDLLIAFYCRFTGNMEFIDDGTTAYLSSALPHRFAGCPPKNEIYSLNLSCLSNSSSTVHSSSMNRYFNALSAIELRILKSKVNFRFPEGPVDLIISSKYLSLDLIADYCKSPQSGLLGLPVCYVPHPRPWKNDNASVLALFPSALFVRPDVLETFLFDSIHKESRIFIGYSSTALLLAEMKYLRRFDGHLVLVMSSHLQGKYGAEREFHDFLATCRLSSQFSQILQG